MSALKVGALFAGYGGLELAVREVFPDAHPVWVSEFDAAPSRILAQRFPGVPNLGDVTAVDWAAVEPVEILTAGYPCQPFSVAGKQLGTADPRHLWPHVAAAMSVLRPMIGVFENVQGHLALGFDQVLRDLHQLGYDVYWTLIAASSVGAPHRRNRLFILAIDRSADDTAIRSWSDRRRGVHRDPGGGRLVPGAPEGRDDGQGAPRTGGAERSLRWSGSTRSGRHGVESIDTGVGSHRESSRGDRGSVAPDAAGEGGSGGHRVGVRAHAPGSAEAAPEGSPLGRGVAGSSVDAAGSDPGGEPPRPGSGTAEAARGTGAESAVPLGLVVGAGGRPVRASGTAGEAAGEWRDDLGARVRDVALLKTPTAQLAVNGGSQHPDKRRQGGHGPTLADEVEHLLPTPRATDGTKGGPNRRGSSGDLMLPSAVTLLPTPAVNDMGAGKTVEDWDAWTARMKAAHGNGNGHGKSLSIETQRLAVADLMPTPSVADVEGGRKHRSGARSGELLLNGLAHAQAFGQYAPAIARWEAALGRPAPAPTEPTGKGGAHRLSPRFVEWLMGLPDGWVTGESVEAWGARLAARRAGLDPRPVGHRGPVARRPALVTRNEQLKALGNGVVPQQAAAALRHLLGVREMALNREEVA